MKKIIIILLVVMLCSCSRGARKQESSKDVINKIKEELKTDSTTEQVEEEPVEEVKEEPAEEIKEEQVQESETATEEKVDENVIREDIKAAIDSYEKFIDEYCVFMKKYKDNPSDMALLVDYAKFLAKYSEMASKMEALEKDLTIAETNYYVQVMTRCNQKILEIE